MHSCLSLAAMTPSACWAVELELDQTEHPVILHLGGEHGHISHAYRHDSFLSDGMCNAQTTGAEDLYSLFYFPILFMTC